MSELSKWLGIDDAGRREQEYNEQRAQREQDRLRAEQLQGVYGTNAQNTLQAALEGINKMKDTQGYDYQKAQANALGGSYSFDMNGDGQIGAGETSTVDPRQSMAGRFGQQMATNMNKSGLSNSTLGMGKQAGYSKNLNDQLFNLQSDQIAKANEAEAGLNAQMGALGNQAGKVFKRSGNQIVTA